LKFAAASVMAFGGHNSTFITATPTYHPSTMIIAQNSGSGSSAAVAPFKGATIEPLMLSTASRSLSSLAVLPLAARGSVCEGCDQAICTPLEQRRQRRASMSELRKDIDGLYDAAEVREAIAAIAAAASLQFKLNSADQHRAHRVRRLSEQGTASSNCSSSAFEASDDATANGAPQRQRTASMPSITNTDEEAALSTRSPPSPPSPHSPPQGRVPGALSRRNPKKTIDFAIRSPPIAEMELLGDDSEWIATEEKESLVDRQVSVTGSCVLKAATAGQVAAVFATEKPTADDGKHVAYNDNTAVPLAGTAATAASSPLKVRRKSSLSKLLRRMSVFCRLKRRR